VIPQNGNPILTHKANSSILSKKYIIIGAKKHREVPGIVSGNLPSVFSSFGYGTQVE